jgi:alpha-N-arabinofuranosidase
MLEFLEWAEAMDMVNVLAIYAGYSHGDNQLTNSYLFPPTAEAMYPVLQEALEELEFCMGSVDTKWGAKRAEYGHPEPFDIKFVEIGNEDWFSREYAFRFKYLYDGIKAKYPQITLIATAYNENADYTIKLPPGSMWDTHHYEEPHFFLEAFNFWDNWQERTKNPNVTILIGEYSVIQVDTPNGNVDWSWPTELHVYYPHLISAIAEGVYLLGAERNPEVVKLTSYAPSLQNLNWYNWTPNLIAFDADPKNTILSTSYYLQKLFATYRGQKTLTVANSIGDFKPLYWAASLDDNAKVYLKVM